MAEESKKPTGGDVPEPEAWAPAAAWALPVIVAAWVWALGWLPGWAAREGAAFPPWLMALAGVAAAVLGWWRAGDRWHAVEYGQGMAEHGRRLAVAVGAATGWWLVAAGYSSPWAQTPLLLLMLAVGGAWWWQLGTLAPRRAAEELERWERAQVRGEHTDLRRLLDAAWCADVDIFEHQTTRAGSSWLLGPMLLDAEGEPRADLPSFDDFTARLGRLRSHLAAHYRPAGVTFGDGDIRPEQVAVDRWWLHLNTKHVEREEVPASAAPPPRSWNMPQWLGLYLDGRDMEVTLRGRHIKVVGATGGGKSVVANNVVRAGVLARDADGRRDCLVWVCATAKLKPFVWPWVEGYLGGQHQRPVIDWVVGEDPERVLRFLRAVYYLARDRNRRLDELSKWSASASLPGVAVVIEEGKALTGTAHTIDVDGDEWSASRLLAEVAAVARSAAIGLCALTQQGLFDGLGAWGDEMQRNFTVRVCTVTETDSDGYNNLPKLAGQGVDTTRLAHHTIYVQPSLDDTARAMPGKVSHLDGSSRIAPVVAEAVTLPPPVLEPEGVRAVGADLYAHRWDERELPELADSVRRRGWVWPQPPGTPVTVGGGHAATAAATVTAERVAGPEVAAEPERDADGGRDRDGGPEGWEPEWDEALAQLLGRDGEPDDMGRGAFGLPGPEALDALDDLARRMWEESGGDGPPPGDLGDDGGGPVLPEPVAAMVAAVARVRAARPDAEWVATAELAVEVWGVDDGEAARRLGRAVNAVLPGLRTTEPRPWGEGRRGRGYWLAEVDAAVAAWRAEHGG